MLQYPTDNVTVYTIHYILMLPLVTHYIATVVTLPVDTGLMLRAVTLHDTLHVNVTSASLLCYVTLCRTGVG
jgi:hypothetical protein